MGPMAPWPKDQEFGICSRSAATALRSGPRRRDARNRRGGSCRQQHSHLNLICSGTPRGLPPGRLVWVAPEAAQSTHKGSRDTRVLKASGGSLMGEPSRGKIQ